MSDETDAVANQKAEQHGGQGHDGGETSTARAVYHVNQEKGLVAPHGEDLPGREILRRAGFNFEKYELFTVEHGKTGREIQPDETHHVRPGAHFRATIRGTDYSWPAAKDSTAPRGAA